MASYRARHPRVATKAVRQARIKMVAEKKSWALDYLLTHPCVDCGETDPVVLEFDHVTGVKKRGVSEIMNGTYSLTTMVAEVAKCEVRCANCHRRVTYARMGGNFRTGVA